LARWFRYAGLLAATLACGPVGGGEASTGTQEETDSGGSDALYCSEALNEDGEAWLELGQGVTEYETLEPGGELRIVLGGQGLLMFPIDLKAGGFCVPPDLSDRDEFPILDITVDVDGEPSPFIALHDQPLDFEILEDDTFIWLYLPLLIPDAADPQQLAGRAVTVEAHLAPHEHAPLDVEMELVVGLEE
jgi:hypothetical protein